MRRPGGDAFDVPDEHWIGWVENEDVVALRAGETGGFYRVLAVVEGEDVLEIQIGEQLVRTPDGEWQAGPERSPGYAFPPGTWPAAVQRSAISPDDQRFTFRRCGGRSRSSTRTGRALEGALELACDAGTGERERLLLPFS